MMTIARNRRRLYPSVEYVSFSIPSRFPIDIARSVPLVLAMIV
jgi:hypothetical protein